MTRTDSQRVVVTGLGAVTPLGNDISTSWASLLAGRSGVGPLTRFDGSELKSRIAAEVKDFDPTQFLDRKDVRRMDRFLHYAVAAAMQALADAKFEMASHDPRRVGVIIGSSVGGIETMVQSYDLMLERGVRRVNPFVVTALMLNSASAQVSIMIGARGPNMAIASACATGTHSIGEAVEIIRRNDADVMIAGGAEAAILRLTMAGFDSMQATSNCNDDPAVGQPALRRSARRVRDF